MGRGERIILWAILIHSPWLNLQEPSIPINRLQSIIISLKSTVSEIKSLDLQGNLVTGKIRIKTFMPSGPRFLKIERRKQRIPLHFGSIVLS